MVMALSVYNLREGKFLSAICIVTVVLSYKINAQ